MSSEHWEVSRAHAGDCAGFSDRSTKLERSCAHAPTDFVSLLGHLSLVSDSLLSYAADEQAAADGDVKFWHTARPDDCSGRLSVLLFRG